MVVLCKFVFWLIIFFDKGYFEIVLFFISILIGYYVFILNFLVCVVNLNVYIEKYIELIFLINRFEVLEINFYWFVFC